MAELWFPCTALILNMFYQCMKFQVYSFDSLVVIAPTKFEADGQTDKSTYGYMDGQAR